MIGTFSRPILTMKWSYHNIIYIFSSFLILQWPINFVKLQMGSLNYVAVEVWMSLLFRGTAPLYRTTLIIGDLKTDELGSSNILVVELTATSGYRLGLRSTCKKPDVYNTIADCYFHYHSGLRIFLICRNTTSAAVKPILFSAWIYYYVITNFYYLYFRW